MKKTQVEKSHAVRSVTRPRDVDDEGAGSGARPVLAVSALFQAESAEHASRQFTIMSSPRTGVVNGPFPQLDGGGQLAPDGSFPVVAEEFKALEAIERKALTLGHERSSAHGDLAAVPGGFFVRYDGQDIYYSAATGAHEVHGDIRSKYDALLGAAGLLGIPVTDENGTPDDRGGRYNHFANGSIYWSPTTGPHAVRGRIRDEWAASGWEGGPLGYPVADQYQLQRSSPTDPIIEVCWFENGAIVGDQTTARVACYAEISPENLRTLVRKQIDDAFHQKPDNVGLHPEIESAGVSSWAYGFWTSQSRAVSYRIHGFRDNGALRSDSDFIINISLAFGVTTYATIGVALPYFTLVASLDFLRVISEPGEIGLVEAKVLAGVHNGIYGTFHRGGPDPDHSEVPDGSVYVATFPNGFNPRMGLINILGVQLAADGSLRFFVNPLAPPAPPNPPSPATMDYCIVRRILAQTELDQFVQRLIGG